MPVVVGMGLRSTWIGVWSAAATVRTGEVAARPVSVGAWARAGRADDLILVFLTGFVWFAMGAL